MSITYTYATLTAAIKTWAEDTDADYVAQIDDFIAKSETRVLRDLDLELFELWSQVTISSGNRTVPKPTNAVVVNDLFVRAPGGQKWVEIPRRSYEYCIMFAPSEALTAFPVYYAEEDGTNIYVVPTPDQAYSGGNARVRATIRPTGLSASNTTSWLGDNVADLLFNACMIEAHAYLKNPAKLKEAADLYNSLVIQIVKELEQARRPTYKRLNAKEENPAKGADD